MRSKHHHHEQQLWAAASTALHVTTRCPLLMAGEAAQWLRRLLPLMRAPLPRPRRP